MILLLLDVGLEMDLARAGQGRPGVAAGRDRRRRRADGPRLRRHGADRRRVQHRALRRRGAHRDQRRHHRPGVRRPAGAGHHRGPHRARRRRGRRRDGPRRAHGRRAPRDRGLGLGPLGGRDRRRWRWASWSSAASSGSGSRPPLFACVDRVSRSTGTLVAIALAFTLAFAELADAAQLAPIVGAFVAGLALSRRRQRRPHPPRAGAGRPPLHPGVLPPDRHRRRHQRLRSRRGAARRRRPPGRAVVGKLVSPLGAIGTRATRPSSASACCPAARWA